MVFDFESFSSRHIGPDAEETAVSLAMSGTAGMKVVVNGATAKLYLDDVFGDLVRDAQGRATMSVVGASQRLDIVVGEHYRAVVVWAPKGRPFICFEPMAGITDAVNLAERGLYKELQTVAPGQTWRESFRITPSGF